MILKNLSNLSVEQKIGQLFFIGIQGKQLDAAANRLLSEISPGGVCLFARNIGDFEQVRKLLGDLRARLPLEPFLSLDQEGGSVDRLRKIISPMPAASSIKTLEEAGRIARLTAEVLRILGFNMNFAPVVDVIDAKRERVTNGLYSRAFARTAEEVFEISETYLNALQTGGCLGCLKHFPGLGASVTDSHESLPTVSLSEEEFFSTDLFPYRQFIKTEKVHAIMVAHAAYPLIDLQETDHQGRLLPSSLNYNFVTKLLRETLDFKGLVLTDDLEMGAILTNYGVGEACKMAILAGQDMLAVCAEPEAVLEGYTAVKKAVEDGEISIERIDESLRRIAALKNLLNKPLPFEVARLQTLSREIADFDRQVKNNYGG
jgi:beta-N-acetylhexosaminidase